MGEAPPTGARSPAARHAGTGASGRPWSGAGAWASSLRGSVRWGSCDTLDFQCEPALLLDDLVLLFHGLRDGVGGQAGPFADGLEISEQSHLRAAQGLLEVLVGSLVLFVGGAI